MSDKTSSLIIRKMNHLDLDQVLGLLQATFSRGSYTREWWRWKYEENPSGVPLLLVAEENGEIVGLRTFWPRLLCLHDRIQSVYQAVDTAVHPKTRGKGIFTRLTRKGLETLSATDGAAIYNFPNPQSGPGYLKLGWQQIRRQHWWVRGVPGWGWLRPNPINVEIVQKQKTDNKISPSQICFVRDSEYVRWRYQSHPYFDYEFWRLGDFRGNRISAVTRLIRRKGFTVRVLIDIVGLDLLQEEDSSQLLRSISKSIPINPYQWLCILDSSFISLPPVRFLQHGFVLLPRVGVNYYVRDLGYQATTNALVQLPIFPGDMDTF